jgi:hypothetical protein
MNEPYGSFDTQHVPDPDPENLWPFSEGQTRLFAVGNEIDDHFRVDRIHERSIEGVHTHGCERIYGELHLDRPVVILRDAVTHEPMVTLTLRRIERDTAYIQVTGNPRLGRVGLPL